METIYDRTSRLLGNKNVETLKNSSVAVFGLGGVGSFCAEALARAGIGRMLVCDGDTVAPSNLNRQLFALTSTLGKAKAGLARDRILDINPRCAVTALAEYITPETDLSFLAGYDYVIDAIDDVRAKIALIIYCDANKIRIISSMGCANRLRPELLYATDIYKTSNDPLARRVRHALRESGVKSLRVVASSETPIAPSDESAGKTPPGSVSFVPPAAGLLLAKEVVFGLCSL